MSFLQQMVEICLMASDRCCLHLNSVYKTKVGTKYAAAMNPENSGAEFTKILQFERRKIGSGLLHRFGDAPKMIC